MINKKKKKIYNNNTNTNWKGKINDSLKLLGLWKEKMLEKRSCSMNRNNWYRKEKKQQPPIGWIENKTNNNNHRNSKDKNWKCMWRKVFLDAENTYKKERWHTTEKRIEKRNKVVNEQRS